MAATSTEVLVVGGGIIGAACAYELSCRGAQVTLMDKCALGHGCSYGNAGWITPCFALPLPMPGMMFQALKWLLDPTSPLSIRPQFTIQYARWMLRFVRSMTRPRMLRAVAALTELSKISLAAYRQLDRESPGSFGLTNKGLLMLAETERGMRAAVQEMELVASCGIVGRQLDADQIRSFEPAVRSTLLEGGVYFPGEAHVEPLQAVLHLCDLARSSGATLLPNTEVLDFVRRSGRVVAVSTTRGEIAVDQLVLATGAWSGRLASKLAINVPMLSGKGYAITVPPLATMPQHPIMLIDRKVAITPRADSLRLAGTLELVDLDESVTQARVQTILNGARQILRFPDRVDVCEVWRGLRPCTPDGLPVIGKVPNLPGAFIAAGHQMLGLQTALGTAVLLTDLLTGNSPCVDPKPFQAERF